jgi:hypothetical protein
MTKTMSVCRRTKEGGCGESSPHPLKWQLVIPSIVEVEQIEQVAERRRIDRHIGIRRELDDGFGKLSRLRLRHGMQAPVLSR